jgi:virginiamycin B lyase
MCSAALSVAFLLSACSSGGPSGFLAGGSHTPGTGIRVKSHGIYQSSCNPAPGSVAGTITEYSTPGLHPYGIVGDASGNIYLSEYSSNALARYNIAGNAFTSYTIPGTTNEPEQMTIGNDGIVYVTSAFRANVYDTLNPSTGVVTQRTFNTPRTPADGMTTSPAGTSTANVWFTTNGGDLIDHLNTSFGLTTYNTSVGSYAITSDNSGNIWYTLAGNKVGERTPTGSTTTVSAPISAVRGMGMTEGPPGTGIWYPQQSNNEIVNVSPTGAVTTYTIPTASATPYGITSSCGLIWFSEYNTNKIGSLNPSTGAFAEYAIPTASAKPLELTTDQNGNVWFTEFGANKVGMIVPQNNSTLAPNGSVYVLDSSAVGGANGMIANFAAGAYHSPATGTITSLPNASWNTNGKMTFDAGGALWIGYVASANGQGSNFVGIAEYAPGATGNASPIATIVPTNPVGQVDGIAIDAQGEVYISDASNAAVYVYPAGANGNTAPIRTLQGNLTKLGGGQKLSFDANGNFWVGSANGILEFPGNANGNVAPSNVLYSPADEQTCLGTTNVNANSFAFDPAGNLLVALNISSTPSIPDLIGFAPGSTAGTCPALKGNIVYSYGGGTSDATYDISVDDNGYIYAIPNTNNVILYNEASVWSSFPGSYAPIYAEISNDPDVYSPVAIATWTNTGWLYGNARHGRRTKHPGAR